MEKIRIIITGGTIDKEYKQPTDQLIFTRSHLPEMIMQSRITADLVTEELMLIDSLDMVEKDRQQVLYACQQSPEKRIIITHGTDTMVETAKVLAEADLKDKCIVLLGAMVPFTFKNSDALFNFGTAFAAVQTLTYGVFITMNGKIFDWDKVRKNLEKGEFEEVIQ